MAEAITKKQIKELQVIPYEKIRDQLKTGHVFLAPVAILFPVLFNG